MYCAYLWEVTTKTTKCLLLDVLIGCEILGDKGVIKLHRFGECQRHASEERMELFIKRLSGCLYLRHHKWVERACKQLVIMVMNKEDKCYRNKSVLKFYCCNERKNSLIVKTWLQVPALLEITYVIWGKSVWFTCLNVFGDLGLNSPSVQWWQ